MKFASKLPSELSDRYKTWLTVSFEWDKEKHAYLAREGQSPEALIIACCDSRVMSAMFAQSVGDVFLHRNIANLVPPFLPDGAQHGTSAVVEYAVTVLKVPHVIVMGHSQCGGVAGCYDMCSGTAPHLDDETSFVGRWMDTLRPGFARLPEGDRQTRLTALEKEGVLVSLENLMTFPFVMDAVQQGAVELHGLWTEIATGRLEYYDGATGRFEPV